MTNLDSILKSRDSTLLTKVHLGKAMIFPVVIYVYESWTIKKAGCQRIDAFELWCWGWLLRVPWTAWRSNQSIIKEIQYWIFWSWSWSSNTSATFAKNWMIGKDPDSGKDWRPRRRRRQRIRWLDGITLSKLSEMVKYREAWHGSVYGVTKSWTWLSDWTAATTKKNNWINDWVREHILICPQSTRSFTIYTFTGYPSAVEIAI